MLNNLFASGKFLKTFVKDWSGDNSGYDCEVLKRHDTNASYLVSLVTTDNTSKRISNVPREAIKFADKP